jgi:hypothetical protein
MLREALHWTRPKFLQSNPKAIFNDDCDDYDDEDYDDNEEGYYDDSVLTLVMGVAVDAREMRTINALLGWPNVGVFSPAV